jgi:hypothetical protein
MKCKKCHAIFETVPCEHPIVWRDSSWMAYYRYMNKGCPCKDCLIKMVCYDYCGDFYELLGSHNIYTFARTATLPYTY